MRQKVLNLATLAFVFVVMLTSACTYAQNESGNMQSEKRDLTNFSQISVSIEADVYVSQGAESVTIEASESDKANIVTEVDDNELIIKKKKGSNIKGKVVVHVSTPSIEGLSLAGAGKIESKGELKVETLSCSLAGSGDILLFKLTAKSVSASIAGSGNVGLKGTCSESLSVDVAGTGNCDFKGFETPSVSVSIAGSSDVAVYASKSLSVSIVGSGSVYYKGQPQISSSIVGSGEVKTAE